eukprot:3761572-Ditylum_brightwellii.AAC.1
MSQQKQRRGHPTASKGRKKKRKAVASKKKSKVSSSKENDAQFFDDGITKPSFINVGPPDTVFEPVIDVSDSSFLPRKTTYK